MNDTVNLSNLELLVLARIMGGLKTEEFRECLNSEEEQKTIPTYKVSLYGLSSKLRGMAEERGIDIDSCIQTNTITTDLVG